MLNLETNCAILSAHSKMTAATPPLVQLLAVWSPCTKEIFTGTWAENDGHVASCPRAINKPAPSRPCYNWLVAILTIYSRAVSFAIERNRLTLPAILVRTLFCPKGTDMAMNAANTTEAVPWFKAVESARSNFHPFDEIRPRA